MKLIFIILSLITSVHSKVHEWNKMPENKQLIMIKYNSLYENNLYIITVYKNDYLILKTISNMWYSLDYLDNYIFEKDDVDIHYVKNDFNFLNDTCELDHDLIMQKKYWKDIQD